MKGDWNRIVFYFAVLGVIVFYVLNFSSMVLDKKLIWMGWNVFITLSVYLFSLVMTVMRELPEKRSFVYFQLVFAIFLGLNTVIFLVSSGFFEKEPSEELEQLGMALAAMR